MPKFQPRFSRIVPRVILSHIRGKTPEEREEIYKSFRPSISEEEKRQAEKIIEAQQKHSK